MWLVPWTNILFDHGRFNGRKIPVKHPMSYHAKPFPILHIVVYKQLIQIRVLGLTRMKTLCQSDKLLKYAQ